MDTIWQIFSTNIPSYREPRSDAPYHIILQKEGWQISARPQTSPQNLPRFKFNAYTYTFNHIQLTLTGKLIDVSKCMAYSKVSLGQAHNFSVRQVG